MDPRQGSTRPPNVSPMAWYRLSSATRYRIVAETRARWESCSSPSSASSPPAASSFPPPSAALVARPVHKPEVRQTPAAQAALQKEWQRLREIKCWDEARVEEWSAVRDRTKASGQKCHLGRLFAFRAEKNSELPSDHPARKFPGCVVFESNRVVDEHHQAALIRELGAAPANMESSRIVDAYSLLPGHILQQAAAVQAYTQAELRPHLGRAPRRCPPGCMEIVQEARLSPSPCLVRTS